MTDFKGSEGALVLGGVLLGSPLVVDTILSGATSVDIDGAPLVGVVASGDVFQFADEIGSPDHTVTSPVFNPAVSNVIAGINFTPSIGDDVLLDTAVTFDSNSVAQLVSWSLDNATVELIERTVKGQDHKTFRAGIGTWSGSATARLDYGDPKQKKLIDEASTATPDGTIAALMFQVETGKLFYGSAVLSNFSVNSPEGSVLVDVSFSFTGNGNLKVDWNI